VHSDVSPGRLYVTFVHVYLANTLVGHGDLAQECAQQIHRSLLCILLSLLYVSYVSLLCVYVANTLVRHGDLAQNCAEQTHRCLLCITTSLVYVFMSRLYLCTLRTRSLDMETLPRIARSEKAMFDTIAATNWSMLKLSSEAVSCVHIYICIYTCG